MNVLGWIVAFGLGLFWTAGCATIDEERGTVLGTVTYRQRIALPPNAVIEVKLVDLTDNIDPPPVVAHTTLRNPPSVPVAYELKYRPSAVLPGRKYAMQARILVEGEPWMVTGTVNHVMNQGRIARADIVVRPPRPNP